MIVYLFPGQGAQRKGMGGDLFKKFKVMTDKANAIAGYSVDELCLQDHEDKLNQTQYTQTALYVVSTLDYLERYYASGSKPDYLAGHSLGEYSALFCAGVFDFESGLWLVKKRGEVMAKAKNGGMAAIVGLNYEKVVETLERNSLDTLDIANDNSATQIVISGPLTQIQEAQGIFEKAGADMYVVLNVSGAFHSRYMKAGQEEFAEYIRGFEFQKPEIPVISNCSALPHEPNQIKEGLIRQMTQRVKWTETICYMLKQGCREFIEISPNTKKILLKLVNQIRTDCFDMI